MQPSNMSWYKAAESDSINKFKCIVGESLLKDSSKGAITYDNLQIPDLTIEGNSICGNA